MQKLPLLVTPWILAAATLAHAAAPTAPIVGGTAAKPNAWPDVVAVLAPNGACTGTLIAPDVVLTAGHCTTEITPTHVVVGTIDYEHPGGELIPVARVVGYPHWESSYDVGVLVLAHAAHAKPRAITQGCAPSSVEVVGFGLTRTSGTGDNSRLHQAKLPVVDGRCTQAEGCNAAIAPDAEFAAGGDGTDSCFGDSGGPAFARRGRGAALFGLVSRGLTLPGRKCGNGGIYVRADAPEVIKWIEATTERELTRAACTKADGDDALDDDGASTTGCTVGGGGTGVALIALLPGLVWRRRRRVS